MLTELRYLVKDDKGVESMTTVAVFTGRHCPAFDRGRQVPEGDAAVAIYSGQADAYQAISLPAHDLRALAHLLLASADFLEA